ncbi:lysis system i-spanin subunit Rz [Moellerella wisconsensis]|uniref:lysis system i-spanin subunit Rz n=1 Tax=Moellerella wisconsensis TaxID=158849 RepID=UPI00307607FF
MEIIKSHLSGYIIAVIIAIIVTFSLARLVYLSEINAVKLGYQLTLNALTLQSYVDTAAKLSRLKNAQAELNNLNAEYFKRLDNAKRDYKNIRDDLLTERRRVQFAKAELATCQLTIDRATAASTVGDATGIELSRSFGLAFFDLRDGIKQDRIKIDYLQRYINDVVKQCRIEQ